MESAAVLYSSSFLPPETFPSFGFWDCSSVSSNSSSYKTEEFYTKLNVWDFSSLLLMTVISFVFMTINNSNTLLLTNYWFLIGRIEDFLILYVHVYIHITCICVYMCYYIYVSCIWHLSFTMSKNKLTSLKLCSSDNLPISGMVTQFFLLYFKPKFFFHTLYLIQ